MTVKCYKRSWLDMEANAISSVSAVSLCVSLHVCVLLVLPEKKKVVLNSNVGAAIIRKINLSSTEVAEGFRCYGFAWLR